MTQPVQLGARIRQLRGKLLSQRELADKAQISVDLIRKLEQGRRHTASIRSLQLIAKALDVDVSELLGSSTPLPSSDPDSGIVALRRVLTSVDDLLAGVDVAECEPLSVDEIQRTATYAWGAYWSGKYEQLGGMLPQAIMRAQAVARGAAIESRAAVVDSLAQLYQVAGCTLVHLGYPDIAWTALRAALDTAERGDDILRATTLRGSLSWLLSTQGRYDEARQVAISGAVRIEPDGNASPQRLSVWGSLMLTAATAAGRDRRDDEAAELLIAARGAADRIGGDRNDYETAFGVSQVTMQTADVQVNTERYSEALATARLMPRDSALPIVAKARHLADVAYSYTRLGHTSRAVDTLLTMESAAPSWMRHQSLPQRTIDELLQRERPTRLKDLALRMGTNLE